MPKNNSFEKILVCVKNHNLLLLPLFVILAITWQPVSCFAEQCPTCHGTGKCQSCNGTGIGSYTTIKGQGQVANGCPACGGTPFRYASSGGYGSPGDGRCRTCSGSGQVQGQQSPTVNQSGSNQVSSGDSEAQRQRALEEQRRIAEQDAMRQAEFEKTKQDTLKSMKGITENELGLKGIDTTDSLGLKGVGETPTGSLGLKGIGDKTTESLGSKTLFEKGTPGSAPVDTRAKGPSKLDLPGGKDVLHPAVNNSSYRQGYDALRNNNLDGALRYFEQAQRELPEDAMVHDALQMVREMAWTSNLKEQANKTRAAREMASKAASAFQQYGIEAAPVVLLFLRDASALDPQDQSIRDARNFAEGLYFAEEAQRAEKSRAERERENLVLRFASVAAPAIGRGDYDGAIAILQQARSMSPDDRNISNTLSFVQGLKMERANPKPQGSTTNSPEEKPRDSSALQLAMTSVKAIDRGDYDTALRILKQAHEMSPSDDNISSTLSFVEGLAIEQANANK